MRLALATMAIVVFPGWTWAQTPLEKQSAPPVKPPPAPTVVAARVNGQEILELAVYRGLLRERIENWSAARQEILNYLIDNLLVDQYLTQLKVDVEPKDVEARYAQIQDEAAKGKQNFAEILKKLHLSEAELKKELHAALRWDKFVLQQATDKVLLDYFQKNPAMFDGSQMQARHILVSARDDAEGQQKIAVIKKGIEDDVARQIAVQPAGDKIALEKARTKALLTAFAGAALKDSTCPSKKQGGELPWFRRVSDMVEPFARASFALQPSQMSDAVKSEFGYHLILAVDRKPGRDVKFEDVKSFVAEVYGQRLREAIIAAYKPRSKIEILDGVK
jgi:parvulin-like peptidyl-prolyl isomerase